jgi:hypothetical protein
VLRRNLLPAAELVVLATASAVMAMSACTGGGGDGDDCDDILNNAEAIQQCAARTDLPGTFVPSQGRGHFSFNYRPDARTPTPFCAGVATSQAAGPSSAVPPVGEFSCYASNPPSSGKHLPPQRNADLGNGVRINIPPDPDVYPPDIEIPREAIPHILEHAGVFVGYNCAEGDTACTDVVERVTRVVNNRIDNHNNRVVLAHDSDLPVGAIGMSAWTRVDTFPYADFSDDRVSRFIAAHSCRFDPENFCR